MDPRKPKTKNKWWNPKMVIRWAQELARGISTLLICRISSISFDYPAVYPKALFFFNLTVAANWKVWRTRTVSWCTFLPRNTRSGLYWDDTVCTNQTMLGKLHSGMGLAGHLFVFGFQSVIKCYPIFGHPTLTHVKLSWPWFFLEPPGHQATKSCDRDQSHNKL